MAKTSGLLVAIPVYAGVDLIDVSAPYEVFSYTQGLSAVTVAASRDPVVIDGPGGRDPEPFRLIPQYTFDDCPPSTSCSSPGAGSRGSRRR